MEVILFDNVKGLGRQGDLVKVSEGHFRNFLAPKKLAEEATPAAKQRYAKMQKKALEVSQQKVEDAKEIEKRLQAARIVVKAKAGDGDKLFGAVTTQEIAKAMEPQGFKLDKKIIETEHPVKSLGEHAVFIKIHPEVTAKIMIHVERI